MQDSPNQIATLAPIDPMLQAHASAIEVVFAAHPTEILVVRLYLA
jgi:hypothetical protein